MSKCIWCMNILLSLRVLMGFWIIGLFGISKGLLDYQMSIFDFWITTEKIILDYKSKNIRIIRLSCQNIKDYWILWDPLWGAPSFKIKYSHSYLILYGRKYWKLLWNILTKLNILCANRGSLDRHEHQKQCLDDVVRLRRHIYLVKQSESKKINNEDIWHS